MDHCVMGLQQLCLKEFQTIQHLVGFWEIVDKYEVNILYTAPTVIRALMSEGKEHVDKTSRKSLRILGSVGEPINPEAWRWYYDVVGNSDCPIVDTWWQTETGGIMITPLVGAIDMKPGSATHYHFLESNQF